MTSRHIGEGSVGLAVLRIIVAIVSGLALAACSQVDLAAMRNPPVAARVLFVTEQNRLFGYQAEVMAGTARGHARNYNQWHATVLNENRQPIGVYGVWDPRLVLEHGQDAATWELDPSTSFLFDVVVPVPFDEADPASTESLPRIIQIRDQELTLLLEVDLTDALTEYCTTGGGENTEHCQRIDFPLLALPDPPPGLNVPNPSTPADERPQAVDDIDLVGDSGDVSACLPRANESSPTSLMNRLENCNIVPETIACAPTQFVPGDGYFVSGADLSGSAWESEGIALVASGSSTYTGEGIRFESGASLSISLPECIVTSVALVLAPQETGGSSSGGQAQAAVAEGARTLLQSGGVVSTMELPLQNEADLRVGALPLIEPVNFSIENGSVLVRQVRITVGTEAEQEATPTSTFTPTPTDAPTVTPTIPTDTPTPTPTVTQPPSAGPVCIVQVPRLNLRAGPGVNFNPPIAVVTQDDALVPVARNSDGTWIQIQVQDEDLRGWVSAGSQYVSCNFDIGSLDVVDVAPPAPDIPDTVTPPPPLVDRPCLVYDFEAFGGWARGDEAWGTFSLSPEQIYEGSSAGKLEYDIPAGVENNYFLYQRTRPPMPIPCSPDALRMQVYGDGSGVFLNVWVSDANGQLWQFTFGRVGHEGWRSMSAPLNTSGGWPSQPLGEAATDTPVLPLQLRAIVVDGPESRAYQGQIYLDDLFAVRATAPEPELTLNCTVKPQVITAGEQAVLEWTSNLDIVQLFDSPVEQSGARIITPSQTTTYSFRGASGSGEAECTVTIEVGEAEPPVEQPPANIRFWVDEETIRQGSCTVLRWDVQRVRAVYLEGEGVVGQGEREVCPKQTQTYTLRVDTDAGTERRQVTVDVMLPEPGVDSVTVEPARPTIEFWATDEIVNFGSCTSINWSVSNVREVYFEERGVRGRGSAEACPEQDQTYTLRVVSDFGEEIRRVTVQVRERYSAPLRTVP